MRKRLVDPFGIFFPGTQSSISFDSMLAGKMFRKDYQEVGIFAELKRRGKCESALAKKIGRGILF